jgi:hypothetical protein
MEQERHPALKKSEEAKLDSFSEHCCKNKRVSADITRSFGIYGDK